MIGVMSGEDLDTQLFEVRSRTGIRVTSRHHDTASREKLGKRSHAGASDPDEVNRAQVGAI